MIRNCASPQDLDMGAMTWANQTEIRNRVALGVHRAFPHELEVREAVQAHRRLQVVVRLLHLQCGRAPGML